MREKTTNTSIIHSVYQLCMIAPMRNFILNRSVVSGNETHGGTYLAICPVAFNRKNP
jgi:hypothetical protein